MYSNKENINILTALLVKHHVRQAVVCPGSRNAPIVHNLNECPDIMCYPVTDERSAGFFALGLALNDGEPSPVAVCVTSGTALLNLLPAVAEAYYQHIPLVVISADRPSQWIDQLDGQTLPQPHALQAFVRKSVSLPIIPHAPACEPKQASASSSCKTQPSYDEIHWHCNRLVNEALLAMRFPCKAPVHINVPIAEPLFCFNVPSLPDERKIYRRFAWSADADMLERMMNAVKNAERPMLVIGQTHADFILTADYQKVMQLIEKHIVVLTERLCNYSLHTVHFDEVLHVVGNNGNYQPDVVICIGGTLVSKRLKKFLRLGNARVFLLNEDGALHDTFMHLQEVVVCQPEEALARLASVFSEYTPTDVARQQPFLDRWTKALRQAELSAETFCPAYSQMSVVKLFEQTLARAHYIYKVHYANSTAIRLANIYAHQPVYCNRGVNGIEGSLSVAVGMAAKTDEVVFCVIGDLSFFYDQNALWNENLHANLRILLLNNGQGGIFRQLKGLEQSPVSDSFVAGRHHAHAEGICHQCHVEYHSANSATLQAGIDWLVSSEADAPRLLDVATDPSTDASVMKAYYECMIIAPPA